jgi:kinesin family protein 6/9
MVATISAEEDDLDESISTCRFAQRVALIKNNVIRNEAVDPSIIIERLKREN